MAWDKKAGAPARAEESTRTALEQAASRLRAAGIENPRGEARTLMAFALGLTTTQLLAKIDRHLVPTSFDDLVSRRVAREPLAFIVGNREFWSLPFAVSPDTLIPRPDSETVVAAALRAVAGRRAGHVLDLGTGTGCLLIAILHEWPGAWGVGVDRIGSAVALARANATAIGVADRAAFVCADWGHALRGTFDVIVSNPPYIQTSEIRDLMPDVARYEPSSALDGGPDGLASYRLIFGQLPALLAPRGIAVLEVGDRQAAEVSRIAETAGLHGSLEDDLSGMPRVILLRTSA